MEELRFPVGRFRFPDSISPTDIENWIQVIEDLPGLLSTKVNDLNEDQLIKTYRPDGWNIIQLVHHLADSHMNSFIRFKLALTENTPVIKPYEEALWAELPDGSTDEISMSLQLIQGLHNRWVLLLRSMKGDDWSRTFMHPETKREIRLDQNLALYAWHCHHHLAHVDIALNN